LRGELLFCGVFTGECFFKISYFLKGV